LHFKVADYPENKAGQGRNIQRHFPSIILSNITGRDKGNKYTEISRTALDSHGKVKALVRMGFRNSRDTDRMVKARENPHQEIEKKHGNETGRKGDQEYRERYAQKAEQEHVFVFEFMGKISNDNLEHECHQQAEVRQNAYM